MLEKPKYTIPKGHHGNIPEPISEKEQGFYRVINTEFIPPTVLSNYELQKQLGPKALEINPLWYVYIHI